MKADEARYAAYVLSLGKLIALRPESFDPLRIKIEDVLPAHSVGGINSVYQLQNYVSGMSGAGLVLNEDGSLDQTKSFSRVDYFALMEQIRTMSSTFRWPMKSPTFCTTICVLEQ